MNTIAIATIDQAPAIIVWMIDEMVHSVENNYRCLDKTCPCHDAPGECEQDVIVDEYPSPDQLDQMFIDSLC